ncbi:MAG: vitamin K epoxide reductase family protein [Nibricoccus sp.]
MPPAARHTLTQVLVIAGLAISTYLTALKFFALPCIGSGGCHAMLHSRYGEIFRLPVGLYGALLWLCIIYVPDRTKRGFFLLLMSGGSAIFMLIQFAVLHGFCLYCTLHALIAWTVLYLHGEKPARWTVPLGLALAAGALALSRQHIAARAASSPSNSGSLSSTPNTSLHSQAAGLYWLGSFTEKSPALVISLDCPACLDLLESLTQRSYNDTIAGPAIYFKTTDANRALTETFIAAVLSQDATPRDAFLAASTLLLTQKDVALNSPATAAQQLAAQFPNAATRHVHAQRILADQSHALQSAALGETTPLLLPREGKPRAFFSIEDIFPR